MTTAWHADGALLARYAANELDDARAYSVEAHLMACETCRTALVVEPARLEAMWTEVAQVLDAPQPGIVERGLRWIGVKEHVARLLAATPSLRLSWFAAEAVALGSAVAAANGARSGPDATVGLLFFLVVAALLPVAGVAVAFGPRVDPTYEVGAAAPMRSYRLFLIRSAAVLATSVVLAAIAAIALPVFDWTAAAWLLPSLGLTLGTLALATYLRPLVAACAVTASWLAVAIGAASVRSDDLAMFRAGGQAVFLVVIAGSAWVLARRHETFEEGIAT
jgi:hypothetical protein